MTKAFSDYVKKAMAKAGKVQYRRKGRKFPNWVKESDVPGIIALEQMGPEQRFYVLIIRSWRSSAADALRTIEQRELPRVFLDSYTLHDSRVVESGGL